MTAVAERLVQGGLALAHGPDGRVILIDGALPGEKVEIAEDRRGSDFIRAHVKDILSPSPDRVEPLCPFYGTCGGCNLQHLESGKQAQVKEDLVKENLRRIAGIDGIPTEPVASGPAWGWRIRTRFHVDVGAKKAGFLRAGSSALVPLSDCPLLSGGLRNLLRDRSALWELGRKAMFSGANPKNGLFDVPAVEGDEGVSTGSRTVHIGGMALNALTFFQSNRAVLPAMEAFVRENAVEGSVVDLYSGVGTLSHAIGSRPRVVLVEKNPACLGYAKENVPWGRAFTGDAGRFRPPFPVDNVVVDPPRTGLDAKVPALIASWKPRRILAMSCNSMTLARDLKRLCALGYVPLKLKVFDMYPQTWEQEACVVLERSE